jgi:hypothetical protein
MQEQTSALGLPPRNDFGTRGEAVVLDENCRVCGGSEVLDFDHGTYRASHIASTAATNSDGAPDPSPDKRVGRSTDIKRESH